ncbi:MAG TPA: BON domain-containing protein [Candidatus Solibacter sp.]|nr:BON domain-containing protein [Candidatus Solibacter sp.]
MRASLWAFALACALSVNPVKVNAQEGAKATADQAKNNTADRDTMQKIRKSVMDDKSLSTSAHNVKIIAQNGKVTLRGQVRSEEERRKIEQKATEVAGSGNVVDDLTIKPAKSSKANSSKSKTRS